MVSSCVNDCMAPTLYFLRSQCRLSHENSHSLVKIVMRNASILPSGFYKQYCISNSNILWLGCLLHHIPNLAKEVCVFRFDEPSNLYITLMIDPNAIFIYTFIWTAYQAKSLRTVYSCSEVYYAYPIPWPNLWSQHNPGLYRSDNELISQVS